MTEKNDDTSHNKENASINDDTNEEVDPKEQPFEEKMEDIFVDESTSLISAKPTESSEKKKKTLRFLLPEEMTAAELPDQDQPSESEIRSVGMIFPPAHRLSDIVRFLDMNKSEEKFGEKKVKMSEENNLLLLSAHLRCLEGVMDALKSGANVNVTQDFRTPLLIATENNDKPMVSFLVTINDIDLNVRNVFGNCPLLVALKNGFDEIAIILVESRAKLNVVDNFGRTFLHEAILQENYKMVKLLIDYGHDLETLDCFGEKPIYTCSVKKPNIKILTLLLDSGAKCDYENMMELSLLSRAILHCGKFEVIKTLIQAGANVNHQDFSCKRTPLHVAATTDDIRSAKLLIEYGADPNLKTIAGYTAFDLALYYNSYDLAEFLAELTKNPALNNENFSGTLLRKIAKHSPAMYLLTNTGSKPKLQKNSYFDY